ncbi:RagB/SusD family nutrient uptake outer membrane protein [Segetibacter koreensis]|uniref:RagB/SusD family nutrient uptake outer membrane protein n=1 Tax=Segetibacter koreensis TaxID=398037 RepID=UPI0003674DA7|nr:RagB/SusD family nutrient uptake outer membrane protein [Segetibacter koreensis]
MKNNSIYLRIILFLFIVILTIVSSCKKLEETPKSFVTPQNFYTTPAQVEAAFAAAMNNLWDYWGGYGYGQGTFVNDDQLDGGDLVISRNHGSDLWNRHYAAIANLNAAIGAMKKGSLGAGTSQDVYDLLMAQAKFLRAYNYFMLVRMFGDLPLLTEDITDPITAKIGRSPIADVYNLIVSDFTEAAGKLPAEWPTAQQGRPTSGAAKGLLAKAYLTMATAPLNDISNYQKAANLAKEVIQEGKYSLVPDITKVFALETKYGPEMMWSFNSNYADINTDPEIYKPGLLGGWGDFRVQREWEQQYPKEARKDAYILTEIDGKNYTEWPDEQNPFIKKFMYDKQEDFDNYSSIMNMPILRFADVLLIYAEAANMANGSPTQEAVDAINKVIDRANGYIDNPLHPKLTTGMTKEAFDIAVIEERNQELCFEYDRWFDLIRKRILKEKSIPSIQQNFSEDDYLFPIPDNDIQLNPMLTQNPGY